MGTKTRYTTRTGTSSARIEMTGPLFSPQADLTLRQNIRRLLQGLAEAGAESVRGASPQSKDGTRIRGKTIDPAGSFRGGVVPRVRSLKNAPWWLSAVISQQHIEPWTVRGARSFGVQQSGTYKRGKRKGEGWSISDSDVMERMANANYRGGKIEAKHHMFRNAARAMNAERAAMVTNLTKDLDG